MDIIEKPDIKKVIIVRKDYEKDEKKFRIGRGKEIAQASHASEAYWIDIISKGQSLDEEDRVWLLNNKRTVTLQVATEEELVEIYEKAKQAELKCFIQIDAGLTVFNGVKTPTVVTIGPHYSEKIDEITKNLKLY